MVKRRGNIVLKLFLITSGLFLGFLVMILAFQGFFFNKLYVNDKISTTEKKLIAFTKELSDSTWDYDTISYKTNEFMKQNDTPLFILDERGYENYMIFPENDTATLVTDDGKFVKFLTDKLYSKKTNEKFIPKIGDYVHISGIDFTGDNSSFETLSLKRNDELYSIKENFLNEDYTNKYDMDKWATEEPLSDEIIDSPENPIVILNGKIVNVNINNVDYSFFYDNQLQVLKDVIYNNFPFNDFGEMNLTYDSVASLNKMRGKTSSNGNDYVLFAIPVEIDGYTQFLFSTISLQPVSEAVKIMMKYYPYLFILAIIFILIISTIYSKIISDPLLELNKVAFKMAHLDFSVKSNIKTNDELEHLSDSLNILSNNLHRSMTELKDANNQLKDDIEKEREQEKIRKEFVANVSHEFKTPLGVIKGFAEGIKDGIYLNKKDYYLDVIIDEIDKMNHMVREMLELSTFESATFKLKKSSFDIDNMIRSISQKFKTAQDEKNLTLKFNSSPASVYGDPKRIEQVLLNLFSNSIKYTPEGGYIIVSVEDSRDKVYFSIENTSSSFSEEDLSKIWDRFYRVDKSRSRSLGGTGLGLSICKNILDLHHSNFGVENTSIGVKFYFSMNKFSQDPEENQ